jgi:hypothetical protein
MTTLARVAILSAFFLAPDASHAQTPDPAKKAELDRKREEMKAKAEQRRAEMKADLERRAAERKAAKAEASVANRAAGPKARPNSFDEKSKLFRCPDGRFTVTLPANPKKQELSVHGKRTTMFINQDRNGVHMVAYADLPIPAIESSEKIRERLDGARDGMLQNVKAKLTGESSVTLQGKYPGREVQAEIPNVSGVIRARIFLVNGRLYQVATIGNSEWVNSTESTTLLGSLQYAP